MVSRRWLLIALSVSTPSALIGCLELLDSSDDHTLDVRIDDIEIQPGEHKTVEFEAVNITSIGLDGSMYPVDNGIQVSLGHYQPPPDIILEVIPEIAQWDTQVDVTGQLSIDVDSSMDAGTHEVGIRVANNNSDEYLTESVEIAILD